MKKYCKNCFHYDICIFHEKDCKAEKCGYYKESIKIFLKRHKTAFITILLFMGLVISFIVLNYIGEQWRGYRAIGGEVLVFLLPFIIVRLRDCITDLIDLLKGK